MRRYGDDLGAQIEKEITFATELSNTNTDLEQYWARRSDQLLNDSSPSVLNAPWPAASMIVGGLSLLMPLAQHAMFL